LDQDHIDGEIIGGGKENVSFSFQEYRLFPQLTALDNVVFAISDTKNEAVVDLAKKMLFKLGLSENDIHLLPHEMSGGMKQRVSLARAFLRDTPILLLDEPTKELDEKNVRSVIEIIRDMKNSRLVIIVTHNLEDIIDLNATAIQL
jgi:ABC-type lipoprotein export system ATPase subunit